MPGAACSCLPCAACLPVDVSCVAGDNVVQGHELEGLLHLLGQLITRLRGAPAGQGRAGQAGCACHSGNAGGTRQAISTHQQQHRHQQDANQARPLWRIAPDPPGQRQQPNLQPHGHSRSALAQPAAVIRAPAHPAMHACQFPPLPPFGGVSSSMARHMTCCSDTHLASASSEQAHLHKASAAGGRQGNKRVSKEPAGVEWLPAPLSACPAATHAGCCRCACRKTASTLPSLHATHLTIGSHMTRRSPDEAHAVRHGLEADAQCGGGCLPGAVDGVAHCNELDICHLCLVLKLPEPDDDHLQGSDSGSGSVLAGARPCRWRSSAGLLQGGACCAAPHTTSWTCCHDDASKANPVHCTTPPPPLTLAP